MDLAWKAAYIEVEGWVMMVGDGRRSHFQLKKFIFLFFDIFLRRQTNAFES